MEKYSNVIAEKVILSLFDNSIIDGVTGIYEKMLRQEIKKILQKALDVISLDNEFWKNDVERQKDTVIALLIQIMNDTKYANKNELPIYLDEETITSFRNCLIGNTKAWDYLKIQLQEKIQSETRTVSRLYEMQKHSTDVTDNHFLTLPPMFVNATNVIGREEDLQKLWKVLKEKKHVILTGVGGSGKTTLAQLLFQKYESKFEEVAWVVYQGDLKRVFCPILVYRFFMKANIKMKTNDGLP